MHIRFFFYGEHGSGGRFKLSLNHVIIRHTACAICAEQAARTNALGGAIFTWRVLLGGGGHTGDSLLEQSKVGKKGRTESPDYSGPRLSSRNKSADG